ncbi:SPOR domain-containing protein [Brevundimonas sp. SORGH_AS_0993]|uniref:SPOR domain-containing protein n=1 Tax=Brevundimonas sp. SORGH_AS_0993 TaxID=3041794 RepID=UPI0027817331|nr:SPOR domain-containing protein [Brevundimonas sp. SORGH_AS_0993]MDQ1153154.1 hypothetical protein [Brevundimonas sp. SORGH_AS_0993]
MTPAEATRPVLILVALSLVGCGAVDADPHRFRALGDQVAALDVPLQAPGQGDRVPDPSIKAQEAGLRPAFSPVRVSVMSPLEMWDARDAQAQGLRDALKPMAAAMRPQSAPEPKPIPVVETASVEHPRPALRPTALHAEGRTIQLGAYSTEAGAREAWRRLKAGADLGQVSPVYETVRVEGRALTRLKVGPIPANQAADLCRAAQVSDSWCRRAQ